MDIFDNTVCNCGKPHQPINVDVVCQSGAIRQTVDVLKRLCINRPFLIADQNTYNIAGAKIVELLKTANIPFSIYVYNNSPSPNEKAVGSVVMNFDSKCDGIVGIGSGVINDIGKILANTANLPYIIVATAPSMDGYASGTSSMERNGLKVSLPSKCADIIVGDTDILAAAPLHLRLSGLGDMLAKYISIAEWRISNIINDEYFCENISQMIREALKACIDNAHGLVSGDRDAAAEVFNGLVLSGIAITYAGCSRPTSGVEHYISHIWDMRALGLGTPCSTHGYQCAVGTILAAKVYDMLRNYTPDKEKAIKAINSFCYEDYKAQLENLVGNSASEMIKLEKKEQKYCKEKAAARTEKIIENWDIIKKIINEEIPRESELTELLKCIGAPVTVSDLGIDPENIGSVFEATRDIRDKYVLSRLVFDLGLTDDVKSLLRNER